MCRSHLNCSVTSIVLSSSHSHPLHTPHTHPQVVFTLSSSFENAEKRKYERMIHALGGTVTASDLPAPHPTFVAVTATAATPSQQQQTPHSQQTSHHSQQVRSDALSHCCLVFKTAAIRGSLSTPMKYALVCCRLCLCVIQHAFASRPTHTHTHTLYTCRETVALAAAAAADVRGGT